MIVISFKEGVEWTALHRAVLDKLPVLGALWNQLFPLDKNGLTITSAHEGHPGDGVHKFTSLHYAKRAIDLRVNDVTKYAPFVAAAKAILGEDYDVIDEGNHVHIEFDPESTRQGSNQVTAKQPEAGIIDGGVSPGVKTSVG
jgi:hypothetical protein